MANKIKQISKYVFYLIWSNAIYGLLVYGVFTWLSNYSLLFAYLGNLALIILGLSIDECTLKMLQSKKLVKQVKKEKNSEQNYRFIQSIMESFISFKTALYLFYIFILLFSQILNFHPTIVGENVRNFIRANDYSILFLLATDTLIANFSKDRTRMKIIFAAFKKSLAEDQA